MRKDDHKASEPRRLNQAEKRAQTRSALIDAGWAVFLRRGLAGTSVEEVATEAGFTRGAFYYNFDSIGELFVELLNERVYRQYSEMGAEAAKSLDGPPSPRETGEQLARMQSHPDAERLLRLWLELLAAAGRDEKLREMAAGFWSGNRFLTAALIEQDYEARGERPPADSTAIASAVIALDIGLAIQRYVDPDAVSLDLYPELFEALFER